ncbi:MAG: phosphatidate cytidylyltransferase [Bacillota bacterium]
MRKTITGLVMLALLLGIIALTSISQYVFDALILLFMIISSYEMFTVFTKKGYRPKIFTLVVTILAIYPMLYFYGSQGYLIVCGLSFLFAFGDYIFTKGMSLNDFLITVLIIVYPILLLATGVYLNLTYGMMPILIALAAAMGSDTFAFYFGVLLKGPKIFPHISPKKTYSGCIFGLVGGAAGALTVYAIFELAGFPAYINYQFANLSNPILIVSIIGVLIAIVSEIGDLGASKIKRALDIKDFSHIFRSHGGVMDRLDSILFAMTLMVAIMSFLPQVVA